MTDDSAANGGLPAAVRAGFVETFGSEPTGIWSAPGRVNLIGEHTDYNDGFVLPFAIDRRTWVAVGTRDHRTITVASDLGDDVVRLDLDELSPDAMDGWSAYPFGTVWGLGATGTDLSTVRGFDAYFASDVPLGSGLSSSAAIECSLALALSDLWELGLERSDLVRAAQRAENEVVGAPTGILDQSASLLAHDDAAIFLDCRDGSSERVDLGLVDAGLTVLVIDTRVEHQHATNGYADRRESCEKAATELGVDSLREIGVDDLPRAERELDEETFRRVRHIVTENERVLDTVRVLREDGPRAIGELMLASHASLRDDYEVTVPELDAAVESAMAAGAIGARMTGGGFGGSAIALVDIEGAEAVADAVRSAFETRGFTTPEIFTVQPAEGARRDA